MSVRGASKQIVDTLLAWDGIESHPHHILPETGWVSFYLREEGDVKKAITLLKRSYEIALKQRSKS